MAFTEDELAYLRGRLGSTIDEDDLDERYARVGNVPAVAAEVLRERLSDLLDQPTSFALSGVYSESNAGRIAELKSVIFECDADAGILKGAASGGFSVGRVVRADASR